MSPEGRMDFKTVIYTYTGMLFSLKKNKEILSHDTTWIKLGDIMLSEISHSQKDKYSRVPLTCGIKGSQTRRDRRQNGAGAGVWGVVYYSVIQSLNFAR